MKSIKHKTIYFGFCRFMGYQTAYRYLHAFLGNMSTFIRTNQNKRILWKILTQTQEVHEI